MIRQTIIKEIKLNISEWITKQKNKNTLSFLWLYLRDNSCWTFIILLSCNSIISSNYLPYIFNLLKQVIDFQDIVQRQTVGSG